MKSKRITMSLFGVIICAISVGFFKIAAFGVDPFISLMSGLDFFVPISFGTLYVIVNIFLLMFSVIVDRHNIGIATFINLFLLGYITQFSYETLQKILVNPSYFTRITCLLLGIVIICFGTAIYMTADLGVSTYDAVAISMSKKWKIAEFKYCRMMTDFICIAIGITLFLLGNGTMKDIFAIVNVGTIITAFFMGALIDFFRYKFAIPLLYGKDGSTPH